MSVAFVGFRSYRITVREGRRLMFVLMIFVLLSLGYSCLYFVMIFCLFVLFGLSELLLICVVSSRIV